MSTIATTQDFASKCLNVLLWIKFKHNYTRKHQYWSGTDRMAYLHRTHCTYGAYAISEKVCKRRTLMAELRELSHVQRANTPRLLRLDTADAPRHLCYFSACAFSIHRAIYAITPFIHCQWTVPCIPVITPPEHCACTEPYIVSLPMHRTNM